MSWSKNTVALFAFVAACDNSAVGGGGPGGPCIEFTCVWKPELGTVDTISTWNEHELAYRMNGVPARITRELDSPRMSCLELEVLAKIAPDAQLTASFDFGADGVVDATQPLEAGEWTTRRYLRLAPSNSRHLKVSLEKQGPGEAAFAYLHIHDSDECPRDVRLTLPEGAPCLDDFACTGGKCVQGVCNACGAGGCAEGATCRDNPDCMGGGCAAGVCRACAANGSCARGERCSSSSHCASGTCVFGSQPSLTSYPFQDGTCGECKADPDCASGHCVLGQCAACVADTDCPAQQRCGYQDSTDATARVCLPRTVAQPLPRGSLCEEDADCGVAMRCAAGTGRAKRCGGSCGNDSHCAGREVCASSGTVASTTQAGIYELTSAYQNDVNARITTCYPVPLQSYGVCEVNAQCPALAEASAWASPLSSNVCCQGRCRVQGLDLQTGQCNYENAGVWWF